MLQFANDNHGCSLLTGTVPATAQSQTDTAVLQK
jgi:hypothetical protein